MQGDSPKFKATRQFWKYYNSLPTSIQQLADEKYALLRRDPRHPSLRLKTGRRIPLPFSPAYQIYTDYSDESSQIKYLCIVSKTVINTFFCASI